MKKINFSLMTCSRLRTSCKGWVSLPSVRHVCYLLATPIISCCDGYLVTLLMLLEIVATEIADYHLMLRRLCAPVLVP